MASASNATETLLLKYSLTTDATITRPTAWYIGLHTADVTDAGTGTEVTGNGYARTAVTFTVTNDTATNSATVTFPTASGGSWGTVSHLGIWSATTAGTLYYHGALTASKSVADGDTFTIQSGALTIVLA
jgi:hypothetical protein